MRREPLRVAVVLGLILVGVAVAAGRQKQPQGLEEAAKARLDLARRYYQVVQDRLQAPGPADPSQANTVRVLQDMTEWSRTMMEAERDLATDKAGRVDAVSAHYTRIAEILKPLEELAVGAGSDITEASLIKMRYYRAEAAYWLAREKAGR